MSATVRAVILNVAGELRVFFDIPAEGFGPEELDALIMAARCAKRQIGPSTPAPARPPIPEGPDICRSCGCGD